ncbi:MAG: DUF3810 domain-containing protein [Ruminococcaceae bacterium]|nr:DUF3810 domain-containing protein [Oscillospiraceae bacterium]
MFLKRSDKNNSLEQHPKPNKTKCNHPNAKADKYERVPLWSKILLIMFAVSAVLYITMCISKEFSNFFNTSVAFVFRFIFAKITNIIPLSVAEIFIVSLPVTLILLIRYFAKKRCKTPKQTVVSLVCILSIASVFLSSFVLTFAAGYRGNTLDENLDIKREKLSANDLYITAEYLVERIDSLHTKIQFADDGFSVMPYSLDVMNKKLLDAYASFSHKHTFISNFNSRLKPVIFSEVMSYAHITGVYTFFTGESNLNVDFPDYTIPYTAAHELAHQRGIAREDEANMIAFLVSLESDDDYIKYCAYVNMFEYIISALSKADRTLSRQIWKKLPKKVYQEQLAYDRFFEKYQKSVTSQVSGAVNDAYLKGQGTEGEKSYGMVVDLTVAYLKKQQLIPQ